MGPDTEEGSLGAVDIRRNPGPQVHVSFSSVVGPQVGRLFAAGESGRGSGVAEVAASVKVRERLTTPSLKGRRKRTFRGG
jgi:hypothetical protein